MLARRRTGLYILVAFSSVILTGTAQVNFETIGPRVGTIVPAFSGVDQFGRFQTLQSVSGSEGAMLVFFRSADW
jgi:hypothetical protein